MLTKRSWSVPFRLHPPSISANEGRRRKGTQQNNATKKLTTLPRYPCVLLDSRGHVDVIRRCFIGKVLIHNFVLPTYHFSVAKLGQSMRRRVPAVTICNTHQFEVQTRHTEVMRYKREPTHVSLPQPGTAMSNLGIVLLVNSSQF